MVLICLQFADLCLYLNIGMVTNIMSSKTKLLGFKHVPGMDQVKESISATISDGGCIEKEVKSH